MKRLTLIVVGLLVSCYPLRNARFVDESQDKAQAWICVADDEPTNPLGIMCADVRSMQMEYVPAEEPPRDAGFYGPATM